VTIPLYRWQQLKSSHIINYLKSYGVIFLTLLSLVLIAVAVSIDGFWGGFAFGLKRTKIPPLSLIIISAWSVICTMISMLVGHFLTNHISITAAKIIGAGLLFAMGFMTLKEGMKKRNELKFEDNKASKIGLKDVFKIISNPLLADVDNQNDIKPSEATLLGLAVAMDASVAAFTLSLAGLNPFTTPFLFGLTHFVLIGLGNLLATRKLFSTIGAKLTLAPGLILMLLGISRLL